MYRWMKMCLSQRRLSVTEEVRLDDLEMHNIVSTG
jgi:hypothetical protein